MTNGDDVRGGPGGDARRQDDGGKGNGARVAAAGPSSVETAPQPAVSPSEPYIELIYALFDDIRKNFEKETRQFEYLDHTADVQLHAWGETLSQSFEQVALCMFNYMTPLEGIEKNVRQRLNQVDEGGASGELKTLADDSGVVRVMKIAEAKDIDALMFQWLDEFLFGFNTEFFVPVRIRVVDFYANDRDGKFGVTAVAVGGLFDAQRDVCGTEIKAITYSAMQVLDVCEESGSGGTGEKNHEKGSDRMTPLDRSDVYVIVDI